jgi:hypothetical protein
MLVPICRGGRLIVTGRRFFLEWGANARQAQAFARLHGGLSTPLST